MAYISPLYYFRRPRVKIELLGVKNVLKFYISCDQAGHFFFHSSFFQTQGVIFIIDGIYIAPVEYPLTEYREISIIFSLITNDPESQSLKLSTYKAINLFTISFCFND